MLDSFSRTDSIAKTELVSCLFIGVVLFKDASANKGGVTSSSLEVLVGLGLSDAEYIELMTSQNTPGFSEL